MAIYAVLRLQVTSGTPEPRGLDPTPWLARALAPIQALGANLLILSDRSVSPDLAPIPALLATGAVHHHLVREETRTRCGLVLETGEAREVGHFALLVGYGAGAVNPYLAFETIRELVEDGAYLPEGISVEKAAANYVKAVDKTALLALYERGGIRFDPEKM